MLDLAESPIDDFKAPLMTIKLAPVTINHGKIYINDIFSLYHFPKLCRLQTLTCSRLIVNINRLRLIITLIAGVRLYANQMRISGYTKI